MKKNWIGAIANSLTRRFALLLLALPIPSAVAQSLEPPTADSDDSIPYRLLLPLLQAYPPPDDATRLQVGTDLPDMPVALPMPESGELQWSLTSRIPGPDLASDLDSPLKFTLLVEVPGVRSQVESAYTGLLKTAGWRSTQELEAEYLEAEREASGSDIVAVAGERRVISIIGYHEGEPSIPDSLSFCDQNSHAGVSITSFQKDPTTTELRLDLSSSHPGAYCDFSALTESELFLESEWLPDSRLDSKLEAFYELVSSPDDRIRVNWIGNSGTEIGLDIQTYLQTSLPVDELANYYTEQMSQQGWDLETSSGDNLLWWSIWSDKPEADTSALGVPLKATLQLFSTKTPGKFVGSFVIQEDPESKKLNDSRDFDIQAGTLPKATALQILNSGHRHWHAEASALWANRLPPGLPSELQIPPDTTVLGGHLVDKTTITILETSLHPQTVENFYRDTLTSMGWNTAEQFSYAGGQIFETSGPPGIFCQGEMGHEIALYSSPGPNNLTTIRLHFYPSGEFSPCRINRESARLDHDFWLEMLHLLAPSETTVLIDSLGGDRSYYRTSVSLQSTLAGEALAVHYAEQLRQAGLSELTSIQSDDSFVSLWQLETATGSWRAALSLIAQFQSEQWVGELTLFSEEPQGVWPSEE